MVEEKLPFSRVVAAATYWVRTRMQNAVADWTDLSRPNGADAFVLPLNCQYVIKMQESWKAQINSFSQAINSYSVV